MGEVVGAAGLADVHAGATHLLERGDLADDHLGHARRAEVHRGVAVDHEHDVAERRDVGAAGRRRAEQAADLRDLPGQADLVVEDPPGAAAPGEQLHLVGEAGAGRVDEPEDRHLLVDRRLRGPDHLLDGACPPRAGLDHRVVGDDDDRHAFDRPPSGDDAVGRECPAVVGGVVVGEQPILDERPRIEEQVDTFAGGQLVLPADLGERPLVGLQRPLDRLVDLLAHCRPRYALRLRSGRRSVPSTTMKTDLVLAPFGASAGELLAAARAADAGGFDTVWTYDHFSGLVQSAPWSRDPFVTLAAIAATTERINVGVLVANVANRHPAQLACAVNSLQSLAPGRVLLGVGAGTAASSEWSAEAAAIGRAGRASGDASGRARRDDRRVAGDLGR